MDNQPNTLLYSVSGALQLNTYGDIRERPMISQSGAYSVFVNPAPYLFFPGAMPPSVLVLLALLHFV